MKGYFIVKDKYWISHFAERRRDQLICVPSDYAVHADFSHLADEAEVRATFSRLHAFYSQIYEIMESSPDEFGMPMFLKAEYRNFSQQCRDAAQAAYRPFLLIYKLLTCGEIDGDSVRVSIRKFSDVKARPKSETQVDERLKNTHFLFQKFTDCGFVFEGLMKNKMTDSDIVIRYPDDTLLLYLWKMLADKAKNINDMIDFLCCSFRLLQDDMRTKSYSDMEGFVDTFPVDEEKKFVLAMDETLTSMGLLRGEIGYYYRTESMIRQRGPYPFRVININKWNPWISEVKPEKVEVGLRIRNVEKCAEYLQSCPESVKWIFTAKSDHGCKGPANNDCKHGVRYEIDGQLYWRCACCDPAIRFMQPRIEDIPHYIKLVELGEKK